jgi:hypothetical protein
LAPKNLRGWPFRTDMGIGATSNQSPFQIMSANVKVSEA